jgi:16S rRNA (cytosine967-C5)-methyltransferase
MDDGSRLVAELAAAALPSTGDRTPLVWDCCAAPGGKTLMLALRLPTASILATDVSAKRLVNTAARLHRYAYAAHVRTEIADASPESSTGPSFDLILCDVPCSGTGTLARNPEIRHRFRREDLARQATRQRAILSTAARRLAPGGRLLYSTCSLEREENEDIVEAVASAAGLRCVSIGPLLKNLTAANILTPQISASLISSALKNNALRTLPGTHPCDGFYAVVLERN